jgi:hypothetical protein
MSFFIVVFFSFACSLDFAEIPHRLDRSYPVDPFYRRYLADPLCCTRVSTVDTHVMPFSPTLAV